MTDDPGTDRHGTDRQGSDHHGRPPSDTAHGEGDPAGVRPDYAREDVDPDARTGPAGEAPEPTFATKDISPDEPDPIPPGTPNFATHDIDPAAPDPVDPDRPSFATRDVDPGPARHHRAD